MVMIMMYSISSTSKDMFGKMEILGQVSDDNDLFIPFQIYKWNNQVINIHNSGVNCFPT